MKVTQVITGALVLGSVALGTVGLAPEAAAISLTPDPDRELVRSWKADEAVSDDYHRGNHKHAFWLPGLINGGTFVFDGDAFFYEYKDGSADLVGSIYAKDAPNKSFDVDIRFEAGSVGTSGPKKELKQEVYGNNSGQINTGSWHYYDIVRDESTLTGVTGEYAGTTLNLFDFTNGGYTAQVGIGANGKNSNMGLATWFGDSADFTYIPDDPKRNHSDINIDLIALQPETSPSSDPVDIPEPATMSLLSLGLLGFGMGALKRKKA